MSPDSGNSSDQATGNTVPMFQNNITTPSSPITGISRSENITPTISGGREGESLDAEGSETADQRHRVLGRVAGILNRTLSHSRESSVAAEGRSTPSPASMSRKGSYMNNRDRPNTHASLIESAVKETSKVFLEYDPMNKRRVLNTYEILREIGRGEHGKVKLAKDLVHDELVAIKVVNRHKKDRSFKIRRQSRLNTQRNDYELKIKREISIMKRCNHKHIVKLKEVLDDLNTSKIYMVLEYLEKGEIKWKRDFNEGPRRSRENAPEGEIPCCGPYKRRGYSIVEEEDNLLSNVYSPNLTFKQSRKIFREVLLGLEYLHLQGIVHRDIKPANLLVSSDNVVKISDFGVSFASSMDNDDSGKATTEMELAKTAGTPAFFAPELCQTNFSSTDSFMSTSASSLEILRSDNLALTKLVPRINHKIDIWALGVTFYCLLFGKLPFRADSEYELFQVIVNQDVELPPDIPSFNSPGEVTEEEFELAKDLLLKLLDKNSSTRIDIPDIKYHPFVLLDLENEPEQLHELLYLNKESSHIAEKSLLRNSTDASDQESNGHAIGIGNRIKKGLIKMIKSTSIDSETKAKAMENTVSSSSDESSTDNSNQSSGTIMNGNSAYHSLLLSEAFQISTPPHSSSTNFVRNSNQAFENFPSIQATQSQSSSTANNRTSSNSTAGIREGRNPSVLIQDIIEQQQTSMSRKGSSAGISEAPQVETKRNVVGDVYLKNQSVLETFKGIQENDDKRRRSSNISSNTPTTSNPNSSIISTKNFISTPHINTDESPTISTIATPVAITPHESSGLHPRTILSESNDDERPTSVISLPLNESFASLDSFDDEFLTLRYEGNIKDDNQRAEYLRRASESSQSESNLSGKYFGQKSVEGISEKFKNFDFNSSMKQEGITFAPGTNSSNRDNGDPLERLPATVKGLKSPTHPVLSHPDSSSSSDSSDDDSGEEGNLTLAFSSKVKLHTKPQFLSLGNRAKSHDSSLPIMGSNSALPTYDVPVVFQDYLPEFEDLPAGLMSGVPRTSVAGQGGGGGNAFVPVVSKTGSSTTLTYDSKKGKMVPQTELREEGRTPQSIPFTQNEPGMTSRTSKYQQREVSSLARDAPSSDHATTNSHLVTPKFIGNRMNTYNNYFNNHYKKDPIHFPFPKAIHLDNDKSSKVEAVVKKQHNNRPDYYRSNSITIGFLQHDSPYQS